MLRWVGQQRVRAVLLQVRFSELMLQLLAVLLSLVH